MRKPSVESIWQAFWEAGDEAFKREVIVRAFELDDERHRKWALEMAEKEAGQYTNAGPHGLD
jgi:hypothetical protein